MSTSPFSCSKCGQKIVGNPFKIKNKNLCAHCYDLEMQNIKKAEEDKAKLFNYIKTLFACDDCPIELINGIDRLLSNGYKLSGIKATIWFYYEIEGHRPAPEILIFIPKIVEEQYNNAKEYVEQTRKIQQQNEQVDLNVPAQTVYIRPKKKEKKFSYRMEDL